MKKSLPSLTKLAVSLVACTAVGLDVTSPSGQMPWNGAGQGHEESPYRETPPSTDAPTPNDGMPGPFARSKDALLTTLEPVPREDKDSDPPGNQMVQQATAQLERRASIAARIHHQVAIGGRPLYGAGSYWQQGSGETLKVRLELQIAGQDAQLLQVCNSRFVWMERKLPTGRTVSRIDLRKLRADPTLGAPNLDEIRPGQATWASLHSHLTEFTGGMPKLLAALNNNFIFLPPQAMRLVIGPPVSSEPMTVPVFAVVGHWRPERLQAISGMKTPSLATRPPDPQSQSRHRKKLPDRIPEEVLLLVGQSDLFPYRIEYRDQETPAELNGGQAVPYHLSSQPSVVLEMSDVRFDVQIPAGQFDYAPGDAPWTDQTTAVLDKLRQQYDAQMAARPGGASK